MFGRLLGKLIFNLVVNLIVTVLRPIPVIGVVGQVVALAV